MGPVRGCQEANSSGWVSHPAAFWIASKICEYPVQRQMTSLSAVRISTSVGEELASSRALAAISIPGVQKPHCTAPHSRNAACSGCSGPSGEASPSMVSSRTPFARRMRKRQESTGFPFTSTTQVPQSPVVQPSLVPMSLRSSRRNRRREILGFTLRRTTSPFTTISISFIGFSIVTDLAEKATLHWFRRYNEDRF